jgi:hypothetical protein
MVRCKLQTLKGLPDGGLFGRIFTGEANSAKSKKAWGLPKSDLTSIRVGLKYPKFPAVWGSPASYAIAIRSYEANRRRNPPSREGS